MMNRRSNWRRRAAASMLLLLPLTTGCTAIAPSNEVSTLAPFPTTGPTATGPTATATALSPTTLTVINNSTEVICAIHLTPTGMVLGENLLDREIIKPGGIKNFELTPGVYDLRADDCFGMILAEKPGTIIPGPTEWEIVPPEEP